MDRERIVTSRPFIALLDVGRGERDGFALWVEEQERGRLDGPCNLDYGCGERFNAIYSLMGSRRAYRLKFKSVAMGNTLL